jgi:hypothetical protein
MFLDHILFEHGSEDGTYEAQQENWEICVNSYLERTWNARVPSEERSTDSAPLLVGALASSVEYSHYKSRPNARSFYCFLHHFSSLSISYLSLHKLIPSNVYLWTLY